MSSGLCQECFWFVSYNGIYLRKWLIERKSCSGILLETKRKFC